MILKEVLQGNKGHNKVNKKKIYSNTLHTLQKERSLKQDGFVH